MKLKELLLENELIKESGLSRIWKHAKDHDTGTITAFRSKTDCGTGEDITTKQNKQNNNKLKRTLLGLGYGVTSVKGTYTENYGTSNAIEVKEDSFLVVDLKDSGNLLKDLKKLGKVYEQDSITFNKVDKKEELNENIQKDGYYLVGTNSCPDAYPGRGTVVKLGKPMFGKNGEFHSKINGRPFVFESVESSQEILTDFTPTEIRSIKHLAEEFKSSNIE